MGKDAPVVQSAADDDERPTDDGMDDLPNLDDEEKASLLEGGGTTEVVTEGVHGQFLQGFARMGGLRKRTRLEIKAGFMLYYIRF